MSSSKSMDSREVIKMSNSFLDLISQITEPEQILFRTFSCDDTCARGLSHLCQKAQKVCKGNTSHSIASLTVRENSMNSFEIKGSHAIASLAVKQSNELKLIIITTILIVMIVLCFVASRR